MALQPTGHVTSTQQEQSQAYGHQPHHFLKHGQEQSRSSLHKENIQAPNLPVRSQHSNTSTRSHFTRACNSPTPSASFVFIHDDVELCNTASTADYLPGGKYDKHSTRRHIFDEHAQPCCVRSCNIYGSMLYQQPAMQPDTAETHEAHRTAVKFFHRLSCKSLDVSLSALQHRKQQLQGRLPFGGWPEYCTRTQQQADRFKYELDTYAKWAVGAERGAIHPHLTSWGARINRVIWRWKQQQCRLQYWRYLMLYVYLLERFAKEYNAHAAAGDTALYAFEAKYCFFQGSENLWEWCWELLPWHQVSESNAATELGEVNLKDVQGSDGPAYIAMT